MENLWNSIEPMTPDLLLKFCGGNQRGMEKGTFSIIPALVCRMYRSTMCLFCNSAKVFILFFLGLSCVYQDILLFHN